MRFTDKSVLITIFFLCLLFLSGCGSADPEMEFYKSNMNHFFENIAYFDEAINSIEPDSEAAVTDLLVIMDSMNTSFAQMAQLNVPDDFIGVEQLSDEASDYMTEAVSLYHRAFEGDAFDQNLYDAATENYKRANLRLQYIISILHGDIPEEIYVPDNDQSTEETDNQE